VAGEPVRGLYGPAQSDPKWKLPFLRRNSYRVTVTLKQKNEKPILTRGRKHSGGCKMLHHGRLEVPLCGERTSSQSLEHPADTATLSVVIAGA